MAVLNLSDALYFKIKEEAKLKLRTVSAQAAYWLALGATSEKYPEICLEQIMKKISQENK